MGTQPVISEVALIIKKLCVPAPSLFIIPPAIIIKRGPASP